MIRVAVIMGKMDSGGKKNLVMEYYRHIDREKVQFDFICDSDSQAVPSEEIEMLGGRIFFVSPYQKIFGNIYDIYRICRENRYEIVHAYNNTLNVFSLFAACLAGVPIRINESLSTGHKNDKKNVIKKILRPFSGWFSTHYAACGSDCGRWQFGKRRFDSGKVDIFKTVINTRFNAYCPELRESVRQEHGWEDKLVVGHIGRFTAQKNQMFLLEIFAEMVKKEPQAVLCLIGDGELRDEMIKKIDDLEINDNVCYLGRREDIQQFYNAMDAFLLPSLYEGLPVTGLEAESCGLPVFFSGEITREASACELGHFVSLEEPAGIWADEIIEAMRKNMPVRCSRDKDVAEAGFDSAVEARRLEDYYIHNIQEIR